MHLDWKDYYNLHYGERAVILGKGPSASVWANSRPPERHRVIAINDAGKIARASYSISRHNWIHYGTPGPWFMPVVDGWQLDNMPYAKAPFRRPAIKDAIWFLPVPCPGKVTDMDMLRDFRLMPTPGGSAINAIVLAKYMGFSSIELVGVDGGTGYATPSYDTLAYRPGADNYDALRRHAEWYAKLYYPNAHTFFTP